MSFRPSFKELTGEGTDIPYTNEGTKPILPKELKALDLAPTDKKGKRLTYRWHWDAFYDYEAMQGDVKRSIELKKWVYTGVKFCKKCNINYCIEPGPDRCSTCGSDLKNTFKEKWEIVKGTIELLTKEKMALLSNWKECVEHRKERRLEKP